MFLEFQTTNGPRVVNADHISDYWFNSDDECTEISMSNGGMLTVLEHPEMIKRVLETHTCVLPVLKMEVLDKLKSAKIRGIHIDEAIEGADRTMATVSVDGQVVASWETDRDGNHHPA